MTEQRDIRKYFFFGTIIFVLFLSYFVLKEYLITITIAIILSYLFFPVYKYLKKMINKTLASFLTLTLMILIIFIPLFFVVNSLITQTTYALSQENIDTITGTISKFIKDNPTTEEYLPKIIEKGGTWLVEKLWDFLSYIPALVFKFFIFLFLSFYIFIDGERMISKLKEFLPFDKKEEFLKKITKTTNQIIYGVGLIAIIEFFVAAIMFKIMGISSWLLLAFIIGIAAFIPIIGPALVWLPLVIYFLLKQEFLIVILMVVTGIILSYGIDVILRFKILGYKSRIHPVILLIGILGGFSIFGVIGLLAGPLLISIIIYTLEYTAKK